MKYRVRQVCGFFVLEHRETDSCGDWYWHILDSGYSWDWADRTAKQYHCEII